MPSKPYNKLIIELRPEGNDGPSKYIEYIGKKTIEQLAKQWHGWKEISLAGKNYDDQPGGSEIILTIDERPASYWN